MEPLAPRGDAWDVGEFAVIDGDTLLLPDGKRLRLAGVDTPEKGSPFASKATQYARDFLRVEGALTVAVDGVDKYGRSLGDLSRDGMSLSAGLIEEGLAWVMNSRDVMLLEVQRDAVKRSLNIHSRSALAGIVFVTASRFHRGGCMWIWRDQGEMVITEEIGRLFARGLSPCRTCLRWPPRDWPGDLMVW